MKDELPHQGEVGLGLSDTGEVFPRGQDANQIQQREHGEGTTKIDCAATQPRHKEEPASKGATQSQSIPADVEIVDGIRRKSNLLIEVRGVVCHSLSTQYRDSAHETSMIGGMRGNTYRATEHLPHKRDAGNLRPPQFEALETILVRCADRELLFQVIRVDNGRERVLRVDGAFRILKTPDRLLSFF